MVTVDSRSWLVPALVWMLLSCAARTSPGNAVRSPGAPPGGTVAEPSCAWRATPYQIYFALGSREVDASFQPDHAREHLAWVVRDHHRGDFERVRATGYVEHYCPAVPSDPELARARASAVLDRLVDLGVPTSAVERPGETLAVCCAEVEEACDASLRHPLRLVALDYWACR